MEMRELVDADTSALLDLLQRALPLDRLSLPVLRQRVFDDPRSQPAYHLGLWDGGTLAAALLGVVSASDEGVRAWVRVFATDPAARRTGLASQLLAEMETRARTAGAKRIQIASIVPGYLWPGVDVRYTPAVCFLLRHGYQQDGGGFNMQVELAARDWDTTAEEALLGLEGFQVRRLLASDRAAFADWLGRTWGPAWQAEGLASFGNNPISTFVATHQGRICAFATHNVAAFDNGFGPTGTEEALRGKGLGRVLFFRCMQDLKDQGRQTAEVCWVGPIAFYARIADAWINRVFWGFAKDL